MALPSRVEGTGPKGSLGVKLPAAEGPGRAESRGEGDRGSLTLPIEGGTGGARGEERSEAGAGGRGEPPTRVLRWPAKVPTNSQKFLDARALFLMSTSPPRRSGGTPHNSAIGFFHAGLPVAVPRIGGRLPPLQWLASACASARALDVGALIPLIALQRPCLLQLVATKHCPSGSPLLPT